MQISVTRNPNPGTLPPADTLGFGAVFTDHMFVMDYKKGIGWYDPRIVPFGPISLSPASNVFHYASEIFEGMKAYRRDDGAIQMFRPWDNMSRLNDSAERMALPLVDEKEVLDAIEQLVTLDQDWVPSAPGTSLYIRPNLYGTDPKLGVHGVIEAKLVVILSPVGSYYKEGLNPVKIMLETEDVRAVRGGTGFTKCGGNYAASTRAGNRAEELGYSQVLWLDGVERKYIEEVGAMNVMFKINGTVVTPALNGSILPGVTRRSCLQLLRDWGVPVEERRLSVDELIDAAKTGALEEAWGTGTAAVISPIGLLGYQGADYTVNNFEIGPTAQKLYDELTAIQWGKKPDPHGWTCILPGTVKK